MCQTNESLRPLSPVLSLRVADYRLAGFLGPNCCSAPYRAQSVEPELVLGAWPTEVGAFYTTKTQAKSCLVSQTPRGDLCPGEPTGQFRTQGAGESERSSGESQLARALTLLPESRRARLPWGTLLVLS